MRKVILIFVLLISLTIIDLSAQGRSRGNRNNSQMPKIGKISGKIIEENNHTPLAFSNVYLYKMKDSSLVSGALSDRNGEFVIDKLPFGKFLLEVKFIGYKKMKIKNIAITPRRRNIDLGELKLALTSVATEGVNVTAEKPRIEYKLDKKIVNVSTDIISSGGTAVEALENVPSINVDIEGDVTLRGSSNFIVYIDGRPSVLQGTDALEQIPAESIDNIEIITNPSAKYDPDGVAGIINVVLKKNFLVGINGLANLTIGSRDKYKSGLTLGYTSSKLNLLAGFDYNKSRYYGDGNSIKKYFLGDTTENISSTREGHRQHDGYSIKFGGGYKFTDMTSININSRIGSMNFERVADSKSKTWFEPDYLTEQFIDDNTNSHNKDYYSISTDLIHKFNNDGHKISALFYVSNSKNGGSDIQNHFSTNENWIKDDNVINKIQTDESEKENNYRIKIDYTLPISKYEKFEAGYQSRIWKQEDNFALFQDTTGILFQNDLYSSLVNFDRDVHSLYTMYSANFWDFYYQLGLRAEYTHREITLNKNNKNFSINRWDYFPTVHISKQLTTQHQLMASYSRRIYRPRERDLDPNPSWRDQYTYRVGNPDLQPEYTDSYEFGYEFSFGRSFISLESYYKSTKNIINRVQSLQDDGRLLFTSANMNKDKAMGVELVVNYEPAKWLKFYLGGNYYHYQLLGNLYEENIDKSSNLYDFRLNSTIYLGQNTGVQLNGFYRGPSITSQGSREEFFMFSAALRQYFFDKKLSLSLQARNLFNMMKREFTSTGTGFYTYDFMEMESPIIMLTLTYKINNFKRQRQDNNTTEMDFNDDF